MSGKQESNVEAPIKMVKGPLPGEHLLEAFKESLATEPVFQLMFGTSGEHIFTKKRPNINETILPAMLLGWKSENYMSNQTYLTGFVDAWILLPVRLEGNYNALRKIASVLQRFMGGAMDVFSKCPGLTHFGHGTDFNYEGLAMFDGLALPVIQMNIPFKFDLNLMLIQSPGFDPNLPLDNNDVGNIEEILFGIKNADDNSDLIANDVLLNTGQTN